MSFFFDNTALIKYKITCTRGGPLKLYTRSGRFQAGILHSLEDFSSLRVYNSRIMRGSIGRAPDTVVVVISSVGEDRRISRATRVVLQSNNVRNWLQNTLRRVCVHCEIALSELI